MVVDEVLEMGWQVVEPECLDEAELGHVCAVLVDESAAVMEGLGEMDLMGMVMMLVSVDLSLKMLSQALNSAGWDG